MHKTNLDIVQIEAGDRMQVSAFITENWGSSIVVTKGNIHHADELPGFICRERGEIAGLITYHIQGDSCEIVTLDSNIKNKGLATSLIKKVIDVAKAKKCIKLWLVTTNDNIGAIRFYQRRGFEWTGFYQHSIAASRKLKPEIPEFGMENIPIKHELEFEFRFKL